MTREGDDRAADRTIQPLALRLRMRRIGARRELGLDGLGALGH